jgi:hypothetical protein
MDEITARRVDELHARLIDATRSHAADEGEYQLAANLLHAAREYFETIERAVRDAALHNEPPLAVRVVIEPALEGDVRL